MQHTLMRTAACAALVLSGAGAQAGLFDDEEARKAIVDLRARITAMEDQGKGRAAELAAASAQNTQMAAQLDALRRSLLDLNNQLESIRGDMAKLRGSAASATSARPSTSGCARSSP
jgi:chromosome segregation ATPase